MIIKKQKPIEFINQCACQVDYCELERAIRWFSTKPTARLKTIYLYGKYPAVSIYEQKIHIHRLLMMYWVKRDLDRKEYVHHKDGNRLNALQMNLEIILAGEHQRNTNIGRQQTPEHIAKRIDIATQTRYGHSIYENAELKGE